MENRALLKQARDGYKKLIEENPIKLTVTTYPLIDNGYGEMVQNPYGTPIISSINARISHRQATAIGATGDPIGLETKPERYLLWAYDIIINENDTFPESDIAGFRVGRPDPLKKFGGIYGYQAKLIEGN